MEEQRNITIAFAVSFILHVLLIALGYLYCSRYTYSPPKEKIIEIELKQEPRKIADILPPKEEKRPEDARHIGVFNSTVEDETVAAETIRAPGRPVTRGGEGMEEVKKKLSEYDFFKTERKEKKREAEKAKPSLALNKEIPEDFYPDYKRGEHTYINVLKHPDVSYFVRLKRVFKLAWDPTPVLMRGRMAGEVSRGSIKVVLGLTIGRTGEMKELFVINGSGIEDYDNEALRAVRASAPFSAPPERLLAADKTLRIAWTFIVYL